MIFIVGKIYGKSIDVIDQTIYVIFLKGNGKLKEIKYLYSLKCVNTIKNYYLSVFKASILNACGLVNTAGNNNSSWSLNVAKGERQRGGII